MDLQTVKREVWYRPENVRHRVGGGGAGPVPHTAKRRAILRCQQAYGTRVLVETGTYMGDMVAAVAPHFDEVHSVEVSAELFARARRRFGNRTGIHLQHGDRSTMLPTILADCNEPALFWLDAHYYGGIPGGTPGQVPILQELDVVLGHRLAGHVILVDDARLFDGTSGFPSVDALLRSVHEMRLTLEVNVASDIIRILPSAASQGHNGHAR
jgi:hypothetical protein